MNFKPNNTPLETMLNDFKESNVSVNHTYQRDYVWKDKEIKSELMRSILNNYPIGSIILNEFKPTIEYPFGKNEIVDGQQRIQTLFDFKFQNQEISKEVTEKIINDHHKQFKIHINSDKKASALIKKYTSKKLSPIKYSDLPLFLQKLFNNYQVNTIRIYETSEDEVREYFKSVQNQEKLKAGEILNAIPNTPLSDYFPAEELKLISKKLNFNDERKELFKNINMIVALKHDAIRMGTTDKKIIDAITKKMNEKWMDEEVVSFIESFKQAAFEAKLQHYDNKFKRGALKLMLLTYMHNDLYQRWSFNERRELIDLIATKIGFYNSKDIDKRDEIDSSIQKSIHDLWQLLKTTHKWSTVKEMTENQMLNAFKFYERKVK